MRTYFPIFHYPYVTFSRRHLPHLYSADHPIFLTWCLHNSLPQNRTFPAPTLTSGQAFATLDRLLDETRTGVFYLRQPEIADMVVEIIQHNADDFKRYELHAYTVIPITYTCLSARKSRYLSSREP